MSDDIRGAVGRPSGGAVRHFSLRLMIQRGNCQF